MGGQRDGERLRSFWRRRILGEEKEGRRRQRGVGEERRKDQVRGGGGRRDAVARWRGGKRLLPLPLYCDVRRRGDAGNEEESVLL